jgi:hypothetical protein
MVAGGHTAYPSIEIWQYGSASRLIYHFDATGGTPYTHLFYWHEIGMGNPGGGNGGGTRGFD